MAAKDKTLSDLEPMHHARLFPSLGYYDAERKCWRALVHGRVFIDGRVPLGKRILLKGLKRAMRATPDQVASETFRRRIEGFLAAPGNRRRIVLDIAEEHYRLPRKTRKNGSFYGALSLPNHIADHKDARSGSVPMNVRRPESAAVTTGRIYLVPPHGLSVISDIDDTIKLTEATSKQEMLVNTFLRPFVVVEGMPALYQAWEKMGCDFHYVSSSPWQLYEPLADLCESSKFPGGSMHLRYFRVRDEMFKRWRPIRRNTKVGIIARIIKALPARSFILIGDSGEKDPEIYRFLAKKFARQIAAVLIRNLDAHPLTLERRNKLLTIRDSVELHIFRKAEEIQDVVPQLISNAAKSS